MKTPKERAADSLQRAIHDALCGSDPDIIENAKEWLMIDERPALEEIISPAPGSFIAVCDLLGIGWSELYKTIKSAFYLPDTNPRHRLRLVHKNEPCYNLDYAPRPKTNIDRNRTSTPQKSERKLHCAALSLTKKSSEVY